MFRCPNYWLPNIEMLRIIELTNPEFAKPYENVRYLYVIGMIYYFIRANIQNTISNNI